MGKAALEGQPGVIKVTRGWHRGREINAVTYDPAKISQASMVDLLKKAKTYRGIAVPSANIPAQ
ncbi:MAG: hypothetical protein KQH53_05295 [Desulfarculaceae bacterium]|nr:hypothetical protein [Desulfarculaceae bacterium]